MLRYVLLLLVTIAIAREKIFCSLRGKFALLTLSSPTDHLIPTDYCSNSSIWKTKFLHKILCKSKTPDNWNCFEEALNYAHTRFQWEEDRSQTIHSIHTHYSHLLWSFGLTISNTFKTSLEIFAKRSVIFSALSKASLWEKQWHSIKRYVLFSCLCSTLATASSFCLQTVCARSAFISM